MKRPGKKTRISVQDSFSRQVSRPRDVVELKLLKTVSERIYSDLYRMGKSVEWLGIESETSRATIRRILDADRNIGVVTLDRVTKALGYKDVVEFFKKF